MLSKNRIGLFFLISLLLIFSFGCLVKKDKGEKNATPPPSVEKFAEEEPLEPEQGIKDFDKGTVTISGVDKEYYYDDGSEPGIDKFQYYWCTYYAAKEFQKIAPPPGCNWGGDSGQWLNEAASKGWAAETDSRKAQVGALIVYANHVQIVRDVQGNGIVVQGMNEGWGGSHEPLEPTHKTHSEYGYKTYVGYVYKYFLTYEQVTKGYVFGSFKGYVLPQRTDSAGSASGQEVLGTKTQSKEPYKHSEFGLESIGVNSKMTKKQLIDKLGKPLRVEEYESIYGDEESELFYDGFSVGFSGEANINWYSIHSPAIPGIRGLKVGDTVEKILSSFLRSNERPNVWKNPDADYWSDITSKCVELYYFDLDEEGLVKTGSYHCNERSGSIERISYSHYLPYSCGYSGVTFYIENDSVVEIVYSGF